MGWWDRVWKTEAEDWVYGWLGPGPGPGELPVRCGRVRRFLSEYFSEIGARGDRARGTDQFLWRGSQLHEASSPVAADGRVQRGDHACGAEGHRLSHRPGCPNQPAPPRPAPYVGGDLEIEVGLFSVPSSDLAAPYLSLLENLSTTAGVSFISAALPFAGPILQGVKLLTGGNKVVLEIGLSITEPQPKQGYCVVMRAPKKAVQLSQLKLDPWTSGCST